MRQVVAEIGDAAKRIYEKSPQGTAATASGLQSETEPLNRLTTSRLSGELGVEHDKRLGRHITHALVLLAGREGEDAD